ncbi:MAG: hypothetical protein U0168_20550 [Nannocystaceae bacterium]
MIGAEFDAGAQVLAVEVGRGCAVNLVDAVGLRTRDHAAPAQRRPTRAHADAQAQRAVEQHEHRRITEHARADELLGRAHAALIAGGAAEHRQLRRQLLARRGDQRDRVDGQAVRQHHARHRRLGAAARERAGDGRVGPLRQRLGHEHLHAHVVCAQHRHHHRVLGEAPDAAELAVGAAADDGDVAQALAQPCQQRGVVVFDRGQHHRQHRALALALRTQRRDELCGRDLGRGVDAVGDVQLHAPRSSTGRRSGLRRAAPRARRGRGTARPPPLRARPRQPAGGLHATELIAPPVMSE